jgi:hypothetical protein
MAAEYSPKSVSWAAQLVRAYTDSIDGNIAAEVTAILKEIGRDKAELRSLVAALAGLGGHAVMVVSAHLDASLAVEEDTERRRQRLEKQRTQVIAECARAVREFRPASVHLPAAPSTAGSTPLRERRSGFDRRLGTDRRQRERGNPSERINLQLFGERRRLVADRRSGTDRRRSA